MNQRLKIRIFYLACPTLKKEACSLLLLSQNPQQDLFEYEIHFLDNFGIDDPIRKTPRRLPAEDFLRMCNDLIGRYDEAVEAQHRAGELNRPEMGQKTIIITQKSIEGRYYLIGYPGITVISAADWKKYFSPPSMLEFILRIVQQSSLLFLAPKFSGNHRATRGCIFDFNADLGDLRNKILLGYICEDCERELSTLLGDEALERIRRIVDSKWIGKVEETGSVASLLKNSFGYDLYRTRGARPSWGERASEAFQGVLVSESIKNVLTLLLILILAWLGLNR